MAPRKQFTGALATPIKVVHPREAKSAEDRWHGLSETFSKLHLLFDHYGIAPTNEDGSHNWPVLVLALAQDFVPGFHLDMGEKRGRKPDLVRDISLIVDVQMLVAERRCSVSEAVHVLVTSPRPEFRRRWGGKNKKTLQNSYHAALKSERVREFVLWLNRPENSGAA
jgi:hypothetical protein